MLASRSGSVPSARPVLFVFLSTGTEKIKKGRRGKKRREVHLYGKRIKNGPQVPALRK